MKQFIQKHWISMVLIIFVIILGGISISQNKKIDDINSDLYYCKLNKDDLEIQLQEAQNKIDEIEYELDDCQNNLSDCESRNWSLQDELQNAKNALNNQQWNSNW